MIDYLFGWIYKTPIEDTLFDLIISWIEAGIGLFILLKFADFIYWIEMKWKNGK